MPPHERREFLRLMAASLAMSGLAGCDDPPDGRDAAVPYVRAPEHQPDGAALHYATSALLDGYANGILVTTRNGRPLKVEGNPDHPWSRGGTDAFNQASILGLYDPARSQSPLFKGHTAAWSQFRAATIGPFAALRGRPASDGLRLLTGPVSSPLLLARIEAMRAAYPGLRWHAYGTTPPAATQATFGKPLETRFRFAQARSIVALGADPLGPGPHQAGLARDWSDARQASARAGTLLTLHAAGPIPSLTRAKADFPLPATPQDLTAFAQTLLRSLADPATPPAIDDNPWLARAAASLHANRGASLVLAGPDQPPELQDAVHRLNHALGNTGHAVFYTAPVIDPTEPLDTLVDDMRAGKVHTLVILGPNPVYDTPAALGFADALTRVRLKLHAGHYADETALHADWHLPLLHPLESWGDARAPDGTVSLLQPTITPLYDGKAPAELLALLTDGQEHAVRSLLHDHHAATPGLDWPTALRAGFLPGTALPAINATPIPQAQAAAPVSAPTLQALFQPDPTVWDGALATNAWLQELPKPLTKLVWQNAATIAPALAARERLRNGDVVSLEAGGATIEAPVCILPGQVDGTVGLSLGYGRTTGLAAGLGHDANAIRPAAPWPPTAIQLRKTGCHEPLITTQALDSMEGHGFVRVQPLGSAPIEPPASARTPSLYPPKPRADRAWAMAIDLDTCIGCNACVTACQSENNIATVGPDQVALGRQMHWLRIDRYVDGPPDAPATRFQPVPCMHCEEAPCEVGCPVEATVHDTEGLNTMVYNRCVGTRACSGYCPYKVRRFNYLDYSAGPSPTLALSRNPDVTVRARGVMEKCTYCVQRIAQARIESDISGQPIPDGAVVTACQSACPTRAITFGDLQTPEAAVAAARNEPRHYALLGELGVKPRTTYLAVRAPRETPA